MYVMLRLYFSIPLKWLVESVVIGIIKLFNIALSVTKHKVNAISLEPQLWRSEMHYSRYLQIPKFFPPVLGVTLYLDGYTQEMN